MAENGGKRLTMMMIRQASHGHADDITEYIHWPDPGPSGEHEKISTHRTLCRRSVHDTGPRRRGQAGDTASRAEARPDGGGRGEEREKGGQEADVSHRRAESVGAARRSD